MRQLMLLIPLFAACAPTPQATPTEVFEHVWSIFDELYGGFSYREMDWDQAYDTWAPQVSDDMSDEELLALLGGMLEPLDDGHVRVVARDLPVFMCNRVYRENLVKGTFDPQLVETYLTDVTHGPWDWYTAGLTAEGIPYVWFPGIDDNTYVLNEMAENYPNATSIIIDLRHSHGGAFTYPWLALGQMVTEETPVFRSRARSGPGRDDFDEWREWSLLPREPYWGPRVVVITDSETISASERMLLMLQELPGTITVGTRTNGALATSVWQEAPNGWSFQLPIQEVEAASGEVFEKVGIPVDVESLNTAEDVLAGVDTTLELAIELARD